MCLQGQPVARPSSAPLRRGLWRVSFLKYILFQALLLAAAAKYQMTVEN